jgi:hypothetical protein
MAPGAPCYFVSAEHERLLMHAALGGIAQPRRDSGAPFKNTPQAGLSPRSPHYLFNNNFEQPCIRWVGIYILFLFFFT